jgi:F0F1-type ATP synthase membrane subunit b/b'
MPILPFQIVNLAADLIVFFVAGYYFLNFVKREKELEEREKQLKEKEGKIDIDYHQVVDNALTKEKKIIEDATTQAGTIIAKTEFVTQDSKEMVNRALRQMSFDIQKESDDIGRKFVGDYEIFLNKLSTTSLGEFQNTAKEFGIDLEKQTKEFRETLLPNIEKEIENYKLERFKTMDKAINVIIQKVSEKALNKSIPPEDHNNLIIESLEKAKKEGIFD